MMILVVLPTSLGSPIYSFNWLIGGDCPFLSVGGDFADNPIEAIAIYAHELRRWALNVGAGRRDARIIREIGTWKPIAAAKKIRSSHLIERRKENERLRRTVVVNCFVSSSDCITYLQDSLEL